MTFTAAVATWAGSTTRHTVSALVLSYLTLVGPLVLLPLLLTLGGGGGRVLFLHPVVLFGVTVSEAGLPLIVELAVFLGFNFMGAFAFMRSSMGFAEKYYGAQIPDNPAWQEFLHKENSS